MLLCSAVAVNDFTMKGADVVIKKMQTERDDSAVHCTGKA
jgi:hypothetical protein